MLRYDDICTVRHKSRFSWKILMFACNFPCFMLLRKTNVSRIFNICAIWKNCEDDGSFHVFSWWIYSIFYFKNAVSIENYNFKTFKEFVIYHKILQKKGNVLFQSLDTQHSRFPFSRRQRKHHHLNIQDA